MTKQYNYWLIVWYLADGTEIHEPACFTVGQHPKEWCDIMLDRTNNSRDSKSPRYARYEHYPLVIKM